MSNTHLLVGMAHRAHEDRDCIRSYLRSRSHSRSEASLQRVLKRSMGQAIADFSMLADGDHVMVCMSGGKDSFALLDLLLRLREHAPIDYHLTAVHINQMQPDYPQGVLPQYFQRLGVAYRCVDKDTYSIVIDTLQPNDTMCSLCSRLRRGVLYTMANEIGATKIALGHHRDDLVETLFLNMFHGGRMKTMAPKLQSDNGQHIVIRPLAYCKEKDLMRYAKIQQFPIIPCNLCGSQDNLERLHIKNMLREWEKEHPQRINNIFRSMQHLTPSHLLDDTYFDFNALHTSARDHESAVLDMDLFVPSVAAGKATTQQRMFRPVRMRNDDIQTIAHYQRAVQRAQHEEQTCAHKEKNI